MASGPTHQKMAADIWSVVDLLRGDYRRAEYGHVILPFTVLRRLDAVLSIQDRQRPSELPFCNTSDLDFAAIASDASGPPNPTHPWLALIYRPSSVKVSAYPFTSQ